MWQSAARAGDFEESAGGYDFVISGVPSGPVDLVAFLSNPLNPNATARAILRRDLAIESNGVLAIDFSSTEAFDAVGATARVRGTTALVDASLGFLTGAACRLHVLQYDQASRPSFACTEFHPRRSVLETFTSSSSAHPESASIVKRVKASAPSPIARSNCLRHFPSHHYFTARRYKRLQASLVLPAEYNSTLSFSAGRSHVTASSGWLGGTTVTLAVPDFSAVTGFRSDLQSPISGPVLSWVLNAQGRNAAAANGACAEGARFVNAQVIGGM